MNKIVSLISKILMVVFIILLISVFVGTAYFIVTLKSCGKPHGKHTEDFYYVIREGEKEDGSKYEYVQLNEFTEKGETKEVIIIPSEVDGIPVRKIGWGEAFGIGSKLKNEVAISFYGHYDNKNVRQEKSV